VKSGLRVLFVCFIAAGLLAQAIRTKRSGEQPDIISAVIDTSAGLGLIASGPAREFPLSFTAEGCAEPIRIDVVSLDGSGGDASDAPGFVRYVFLGSVRDHQDLTAARVLWFLANVRFVAGLRTGRPGMRILFVVIPKACPGLTGLDWVRLSPW